MKYIAKKIEYKKILVFSSLIFLNIGFKEILNFFSLICFVNEIILILTLISLTILLNNKINNLQLLVVSIIFYSYLFLNSFGSGDIDYGLQKAFLGLLIPIILFDFFCRIQWKEEEVIKYLCFAVSIIDIIGILYKIKTGFFDRSVSFGLLGPITFGWLNGMAFLSLVLQKRVNKNSLKFLFTLFFFLMLIWTGSKGPLISVIFICLISFNTIIGRKFLSKLIAILFIVFIIFLLSLFIDDIRSVRGIVEFITDPGEYSEGVGKGSIGSRTQFIDISLNLFEKNPIFGSGFGSWQYSNYISDHKYPHNIYFELLSETGFIGIFLFIALILILKFKSIFGYIGFFGLLTLCFSGDFSYFRYAFFPILLSTYFYKK